MNVGFIKSGFLALGVSAIAGNLLISCAALVSQGLPSNGQSMQGMDHTKGMHGIGDKNAASTNHSMSTSLGPVDADFDLRFIDGMTPHHEGAISMAKTAQQSKRPEIRKLAANIIASQQQEIQQMRQWRKAWYPKAGEAPTSWSPEQRRTITMNPQQMHSMSMHQDLGPLDDRFDLRFLNAMIPHHEGALEMAKTAQQSKRPEVRKLASSITASQQGEIQQMKQWRKSWYAQ
jgi:uncharacterized protein (DUF305 family)